MTETAKTALQLAIKMIDAVAATDLVAWDAQAMPPASTAQLKVTFEAALASLSQGPLVIDGGHVFMRLRAAAESAGSEAALARAIGVSKQHLSDIMHARKPAGPAVLRYLKLKPVAFGRPLYTPIDDAEQPVDAKPSVVMTDDEKIEASRARRRALVPMM